MVQQAEEIKVTIVHFGHDMYIVQNESGDTLYMDQNSDMGLEQVRIGGFSVYHISMTPLCCSDVFDPIFFCKNLVFNLAWKVFTDHGLDFPR